jgi:hypothetical protein
VLEATAALRDKVVRPAGDDSARARGDLDGLALPG